MRHLTRRELLQALGATVVISASGFTTLAFARANYSKETRTTMDTLVTIELSHESSSLRAQALSEAFEAIDAKVAFFDRYTTNSPLAVLNTTGKLQNAPKELISLLMISKEFAKNSDNLFNPTVQPLVDYFLKTKTFDTKEYQEVSSAIATMDSVHVRGTSVQLEHQAMGITLDGIAKGYIVDVACQVLDNNGIEHYMVNAGGDIAVKGSQYGDLAWTVGIQSPDTRTAIIEMVALRKGAIATSGGYERHNPWNEHYTHLVNPYTAQSPNRMCSVTVIAPTTVEADALATTLSMMQVKQALSYIAKYPESACYLLTNQGRVVTSPSWKTFSV